MLSVPIKGISELTDLYLNQFFLIIRWILFHEQLFSGCFPLIKVLFPTSKKSIESHLFEKCASLALITIPPPVQSIESNAFNGCISLTQINLPSSLIDIGNFFSIRIIESNNNSKFSCFYLIICLWRMLVINGNFSGSGMKIFLDVSHWNRFI